MATGVNMPGKPKQSGGIGTVAGGVIGAIYGGPAGAATGAGIGGMAENMISGPQPKPPDAVETGPMHRRMNQLENSPEMQIRQSIDSLKFVEDPAQRAELAKPLLQAEYMAKKGSTYG